MTKQNERRKAAVFWFMTTGYMALIFCLSSTNLHNVPVFVSKYDKIAHILIYLPLAFLLYRTIKKSGLKRHVFIIAFLFASIYGITDEFHQSFVVGRIASAGDVFADSFGAFAGSLLASFLRT